MLADIGVRLRQARKRNGSTISEAAATVNKHENSIIRWESGESQIGFDDLKKLASKYEVSVAWIIGEEDPEEEILMEAQLTLRTASKELSPSAMRSLVDTIKFLRDQQREIERDQSE